MQLITDEYRSLNEQLHAANEGYGKSGHKWASAIFQLAIDLKTQDILDYGCGKSTLSLQIPFAIKQYDPAIPKYAELPQPADIVVCTDVLEHIEPELLQNVLKHLQSLVKKVGFFVPATRPALKTLPDGRNAHLIQQDSNWWLTQLLPLFKIRELHTHEKECLIIVNPLENK